MTRNRASESYYESIVRHNGKIGNPALKIENPPNSTVASSPPPPKRKFALEE
jgi:hypothetical protein